MLYFNIQVGDIVEYFKEEYQVKDKDEIGRLFMRRLSDRRADLAFDSDVYFLRKTVEDEENER